LNVHKGPRAIELDNKQEKVYFLIFFSEKGRIGYEAITASVKNNQEID